MRTVWGIPFQATLRQEGLIGKLKSDRSEPVQPDWSEDQPVRDRTELADDGTGLVSQMEHAELADKRLSPRKDSEGWIFSKCHLLRKVETESMSLHSWSHLFYLIFSSFEKINSLSLLRSVYW